MGQATSQSITPEQVVQNGYIIAKGKVYDLSRFIEDHGNDGQHPIGILKSRAGKDCTTDFKLHGKYAKAKWKKYLVGYLAH